MRHIRSIVTAVAVAAWPALADGSDIRVEMGSGEVYLYWPISNLESGALHLDLAPDRPIVDQIWIVHPRRDTDIVARGLDPLTLLTVGTRDLKKAEGWVAFFDNPPTRPHQTYPVRYGKRFARVEVVNNRATVTVAQAEAGPFRGDLRFTVWEGSPLILMETVLRTEEDGRAIVYDTGLVAAKPDWKSIGWRDTSGSLRKIPFDPKAEAVPIAVAGRAIVAEGPNGAIAAFPPPHRFFYPQDEAFNLQFAWYGRGYGGADHAPGIGIRQSIAGDKRFVPWFNAPPGTDQHLGVFFLVRPAYAWGEVGPESVATQAALETVARYTHGDRFKDLPGRVKFTSHYHVEHTLEYLRKQKEQGTTGVPKGLEVPGMVRTFKARGLDIVHLAEFHNGDAPNLTDEVRLPRLKLMHEECDRLSDDRLLILPGEEANVHLGGHWLSFFPRPVYWVLNRKDGKPFVEEVEGYGKVYHVGSPADVLKLMELEGGLMWTSHPRIKGSIGFPDRFKDRDFFRSDHFLGAAWKAMPADLSRPTLGWRALDLMDDMANWGFKKQVVGEADLFRMEPDFESYGHLNVNYLKLDRVPKFRDGWTPVLDTLRAARFFTTTGEVLIKDFRVDGAESGQDLEVKPGTKSTVTVDLEWTFPMAFAEVISGDGSKVYRERVDLSDSKEFDSRKLTIPIDLAGRKWVRFEAWDIAADGAFTQPVWISEGK